MTVYVMQPKISGICHLGHIVKSSGESITSKCTKNMHFLPMDFYEKGFKS